MTVDHRFLTSQANSYFQQLGQGPPTVLLDGNNLMVRAGWFHKERVDNQGKPIGALLGLLKTLRALFGLGRLRGRAILTFDAGGSARRKALNKSYKGGRGNVYSTLMPSCEGSGPGEARQAWLRQQLLGAELFKLLGIPAIALENVEADDIIAWLATLGPSLIVSGDGDFHQLLREDVCIYDPGRTELITVDSYSDILSGYYDGAPPNLKQAALAKAIVGDKSDNLPGVPGVGWKGVKKLLACGATVPSELEEGSTRQHKLLAEHRSRVDANFSLVDLSRPLLSHRAVRTLVAFTRAPRPKPNILEFSFKAGASGLGEFALDPELIHVAHAAGETK